MITISTTTGYSGMVTATCALTSQPSGAIDLPTCSMVNNTVQISGSTTQTASMVADVYTTAATAKLAYPALPDRGEEWRDMAGAALALVIFLGIPARRRNWRSMLGAFILLAVLGGMSACGAGGAVGGSGGGNGGNGGNSGTTAGTYTFTVTATGVPAMTPAPTATFTVTVN
jgi:trimeric autotransporter adhesin